MWNLFQMRLIPLAVPSTPAPTGAEQPLPAQGGLVACGRARRAQPGCPQLSLHGLFQPVCVYCAQRADLGSSQLTGQLGEEMRTLLFFSRNIQHSSLVKY